MVPVIVVLALAVLQVALVANDRVLVAHAAREAARAAAVDPDPAVAADAAVAAGPLDEARLSVTLGPARSPGDRLTVTVGYRSATSVPLVGPLLGDVELSTTAVVRVE